MVDIDTLADVVAFTERLVEALRQPIRAADKEFVGGECCASSAARKRKESLASLARLTQQVRVPR